MQVGSVPMSVQPAAARVAKHAKSSAALVSVVIHAIFIVVALSFVAVSVIKKDEVDFEATPIKRPKMNLRKLEVPVKQSKPQPKLRKQIVVKPNVAKITPDIKMPEIVGVKGGLGAGGGGFGAGASLGFSMPEINLFGVKSRGEKICIILDSSAEMMYDEMGGIAAYTIIKDELVRILEGIPPTALVNVMVYNVWHSYMRFPQMVPASPDNVSAPRTRSVRYSGCVIINRISIELLTSSSTPKTPSRPG